MQLSATLNSLQNKKIHTIRIIIPKKSLKSVPWKSNFNGNWKKTFLKSIRGIKIENQKILTKVTRASSWFYEDETLIKLHCYDFVNHYCEILLFKKTQSGSCNIVFFAWDQILYSLPSF